VVELADQRASALAGDAEGHVLERVRLERTLELVRGSPPTVRRVFELTYGAPALSARQVSDELGLSVQRVRQVLCELRARLRRGT